MKADTHTLQDVLHGDRRFVVPVYQRPYVWSRERQWEPLWTDVESTAVRLVETRQASYHVDKPVWPRQMESERYRRAVAA